ncbi:uncharacterized protein LOC130126259 [Lampris incognitus]|uniref:uncharacterized protein LOC130126259 n=1 Tax=Lampris incognitus TaxID=2546036 RepID=UPI0024B590A3|nr:uncharacterized protein LOC130126259 [Lampris incognitus]
MTEVILRLGKGVYGVSNRTCHRSLLEIQRGQCERLTHVLSLSTRSPSCGFQSGQPVNSDTVVKGGCYATAQSPCPGRLGGSEGVAKSLHDLGLSREGFLLKLTEDHTVDRRLFDTRTVGRCARYRRGSAARRAYSHRSKLRRTSPFSGAGFAQRRQNLDSHLLFGCDTIIFTRHYNGNGGRADALYKTKAGYYNILEVSPEATQTQIKTAYYKQSFIYHPDKNAGSEEATARFSDINEAYHVLGNKALRRKYDRGILTQSDLTSATTRSTAKDSGSSAKQQTRTRHSVVGTDSQSTYDFDNFFKSHYGDQLQREKDLRSRKMKMQEMKEAHISEVKLGKIEAMVVGALIVIAVTIVIRLKG